MKSILTLLCVLTCAALLFSCQQKSCPTYSNAKNKPVYKPTFLEDINRR